MWFRRDLRIADNHALLETIAVADGDYIRRYIPELAQLSAVERFEALAMLKEIKADKPQDPRALLDTLHRRPDGVSRPIHCLQRHQY